jgi:hypothetical protein
MEPVNSQPQQLQRPSTQELPHLVVNEPKRSKVAIFGIVVLSLLLLAIPGGIYLVSQDTQFAPQAAITEKLPEVVTGIFLESKLSLESQGGVIPVDIYLKSPLDSVNLVNAQISFNPGLLSVDKIATGSANPATPAVFSKWFEAGFDNTSGQVSIISGLPNPGIKTGGSSDDKIYLATVFLKPKNSGTAVLQISQDSQILRNTDNVNIFKTGNDLALNLPAAISEATSAGRISPKVKSQSEPLIVLTSPQPALNYSYFKALDVVWSSFNVEIISAINLYLNGELLGSLGQNLKSDTGKFQWQPKDTLALHYIQPVNTYEIELIGLSKDGTTIKTTSGPFGILGIEEVSGIAPNVETFSKNQLTITDASRSLTNFLVSPLKDSSLDLNKDGLINDLDLFLIRQNLLGRGVIK